MEAEQQMGDFNQQDLANTAWTFATVGQPDAQLFMVLVRVAEQCIGDSDLYGPIMLWGLSQCWHCAGGSEMYGVFVSMQSVMTTVSVRFALEQLLWNANNGNCLRMKSGC